MISSSGRDRLWTLLSLVGLCMTLSRFALPRTLVARPAASRGPSALAPHRPGARRPVESWSLEFARRAADRERDAAGAAARAVSGAARPAALSARVAPAGLFSGLKSLLASALGRPAVKARRSPFKARPLAARGMRDVGGGRQGLAAGMVALAARPFAAGGAPAGPAGSGESADISRTAPRRGALSFAPAGGPAGASPFLSAAPSAVAPPGASGSVGHERARGPVMGAGAGFGIGGADVAPKPPVDEDREAHPISAAPREASRDDSAAKKTALREEAIFVRDLVAKPYAAALREALARYAEQLSTASSDPQVVEAASAASALAGSLELSGTGDAAVGASAALQAVLLFRLREALPAAAAEKPSPWDLLPGPARASLAGTRTPGAEAKRALYELDAWVGPGDPALSSAGDGLATALARAAELEGSGDGASKSIALAQGAAGALGAVRDLEQAR